MHLHNYVYAFSPIMDLCIYKPTVLIHVTLTLEMEVRISKTFTYLKLKHFRMFASTCISLLCNVQEFCIVSILFACFGNRYIIIV